MCSLLLGACTSRPSQCTRALGRPLPCGLPPMVLLNNSSNYHRFSLAVQIFNIVKKEQCPLSVSPSFPMLIICWVSPVCQSLELLCWECPCTYKTHSVEERQTWGRITSTTSLCSIGRRGRKESCLWFCLTVLQTERQRKKGNSQKKYQHDVRAWISFVQTSFHWL